MENKLKELTDRLYDEGLEKGRAEAERLVEQAKAQAAKIVAEAEAEAAQIVRKAEQQAADTQKNSLTEISLAGKQAVAKIKEQIETLVVAKAAGESLKEATMDADFLQKMLLEVASAWKVEGTTKLEALMPAALEQELQKRFESSAQQLLKAGVEVGYSKDVRNGFRIGEKNGGYYISFTEETLSALLEGYLREKVSKLLFA